MPIKNDYIKVQVSTEQKNLFKDIAKKKKVSMSKFMVVATEERALREKEKQRAWRKGVSNWRVNCKRLSLKWRAKEPIKKVF